MSQLSQYAWSGISSLPRNISGLSTKSVKPNAWVPRICMEMSGNGESVCQQAFRR